MKAYLVLSDGTCFEGEGFGALYQHVTGEVVFSTAMTGYPELMTDPSYFQQILTLSYPLIGNYGVAPSDMESEKIHVSGIVAREISPIASSWRSEMTLNEWMIKHNCPGISGVDTRALVHHLRKNGSMVGALCTDPTLLPESIFNKAKETPSMEGRELASQVSTSKRFISSASERNIAKYKVVAFDFGIKKNMIRLMNDLGCEVHVVPAHTSASIIKDMKPDGIFLSNGPGDPGATGYAIDTVKQLIGLAPILGICLGYQILALSIGAKTYKLKFGHRGSNQPVSFGSKVLVTSQNHGFAVDADTLVADEFQFNISDGTLEGFTDSSRYLLGVQYHPEAAPGPRDSRNVFQQFLCMMVSWKKKEKVNVVVEQESPQPL